MLVVVTLIAQVLLRLFQALLFARAMLRLFPTENNPFVRFVTAATEPLLVPVRNVLNKFPVFAHIPFDFSIIIVFIVIELLLFFI